MRIVERLKLHTSWRDSHGELNDAPNEAAALLEQAEAALEGVSGAAFTTYRKPNGSLGSIEGDDGEMCFIVPNDEMFELRALLAKLHEGGE